MSLDLNSGEKPPTQVRSVYGVTDTEPNAPLVPNAPGTINGSYRAGLDVYREITQKHCCLAPAAISVRI